MHRYFFFDASALAKRYHPEKGSNVVELIFKKLFAQSGFFVTISALGLAETVSVLVRKKNRGDLPEKSFQMVQARLMRETSTYAIQPLNNFIITRSIFLIVKHNINSSDAICLYQAISLQNLVGMQDIDNRVIFITSDKRLFRAARSEGLLALNPETATTAETSTFFER